VSEDIPFCVSDHTNILVLEIALSVPLATCKPSDYVPGTLNIMLAFHASDVAKCHRYSTHIQTYTSRHVVFRVSAWGKARNGCSPISK
jgi:hypothetical protein